jgi:hypothetical protein
LGKETSMAAKRERPQKRIQTLRVKSLRRQNAKAIKGGSAEGGHATDKRAVPLKW